MYKRIVWHLLFLANIPFLSICLSQPSLAKENMMAKKILFILMPKNFNDTEFLTPYTTLKSTGNHIDVAGLETGKAQGSNGATFSPNLLLHNLSKDDLKTYDALIIPGGGGCPQYLWGNKEVQQAVQTVHQNGAIVATICWAGVVAAESGIVKGKQATVYPSENAKEIFTKEGVNFVDQGTVTLEKEKIITSKGPQFAQEFVREIIRLLETA